MTAARGFSSAELAQVKQETAVDDRVSRALIMGDLSQLSPKEKLDYYLATCRSLGLNPLTKPFAYIKTKNGGEILYARKDCSEQLRKMHAVSLNIVAREMVEGVYVVTARATIPGNRAMGGVAPDRVDESTGAVAIENVRGEDRANAIMKAETKAKRRVTLSICGLSMPDETEIDAIPGAQVVSDPDTGEVLEQHSASNQQDSRVVVEMHLQRIAACVSLDDWRQVTEAIKADAGKIGKTDLAYLRAMAKDKKEQIAAMVAASTREPGSDNV